MLNIDTFSEEQATEEVKVKLRSEESRLVRIIEALRDVQDVKSWQLLSEEVFKPLVNILEKDIKTEARKEDLSPQRLNRLSGELKWAEKYADLAKLENNYQVHLKSIRTKLYGEPE